MKVKRYTDHCCYPSLGHVHGERTVGLIKLKKLLPSPGRVVQLVAGSSHTPKGCRFDSQSGHIPRLQVQPLVGERPGATD